MLGGENLGTLRVNIEANLANFNNSLSSAQTGMKTFAAQAGEHVNATKSGLLLFDKSFSDTAGNIKQNTSDMSAHIHNHMGKGITDFKNFGDAVKNMDMMTQMSLTTLGTVVAGIGGTVVAGMGLAVKTFADFETAMKNVQSVSNATQREFEQLSDYAMKLGKDTVFSSKQAAEALYYMASAGYSVKDQMKATDSILQLATATQWGLSQAAEFTASTLTAFGLKAENAGHVVDVMAKASAMSQATMEKLGYSLPYVATQAHMLGLSLETTVAALSLLYDGGLKGEMAGERLRGALNSLLNPTAKEQEALEKMGITLESVSPATNKLSDIVKVFESHTKLAGDAQWNAANATKIFGERAEGMTVLVAQGSAKLMEYEKNLTNSAGAAQKMADIQQEALSKSFEQLKGSIENLLIKMGGELAPTVKSLAGFFEGLTDKLSEMNPTVQTAATYFTAFGGGITLAGGAAIMLLAKLPDLKRGVEALAAVGISVKLLFAEVGIILTSLAVAITLYQSAMKQSEDPQNKAIKQFNDLKKASEELRDQFDVLKSEGFDPLNMTVGEFSKSSYWAKEALEKLYPALNATYGENTKLSVVMSEINKKTSDYTTGLIDQNAGLKVTLPTLKEVAKAHTDTGKATTELTDAEKKLLDQMKSELNPSFEKSAKIFQDIRLDTHALTLVTDELGFSYKALTPIVHETAKRTQEDAVETMKVQVQAFDDTKKSIVVVSGAYVNLLNKEKLLNNELMSIRILALPKILEAEQKAHDKSVTDAITFWGKKIEVDNKFQNDVTKLTGDAIAERNAGFDEDATKRLLADANQYQKEEAQLLKFASNKAHIYDSEKEQLALTYVDMYNLAVGHGKDTADIEKWYHDESLKLTMQYYNDYVDIAQDGVNSILDVTLALLNSFSTTQTSVQGYARDIKAIQEKSAEDTKKLIINQGVDNRTVQQKIDDASLLILKDQKDAELKIIKEYQFSLLDEKEQEKITTRENYDALIELYKKYGMDTKEITDARHKAMRQIEIDSWSDSLIGMADWVGKEVKLLKDLQSAYVSVTKIIDIVGQAIDWLSGKSDGSSGGGIGDLTKLLSGGEVSQGSGTSITSITDALNTGGMVGGQQKQPTSAQPSNINSALNYLPVVGSLYWMYSSYEEAAKLQRDRIKTTRTFVDTLQQQVKDKTITGEMANLAAFKQYYKAGYPVVIINGTKYTHEELGELIKYLEEGGSPGASYATPKMVGTVTKTGDATTLSSIRDSEDTEVAKIDVDETKSAPPRFTPSSLSTASLLTGSPDYINSFISIDTGLNNIDTSVKTLVEKYDRSASLFATHIGGIIQKVGDDSKITSNLLSDGLRQVNTTLVDKIDTTNNKLDELIKRTPPAGGFTSVNQSAIDTVANLVAESLRRRNVM